MAHPVRPLLLIGFLSVVLLLVFFAPLSFAQQLSGSPGDAYVFPGEAPVAPDGTSQQGGPAISGNIVFWTEYDENIRKTRLFFKDLSKGEDEPGHALIEGQSSGETPAVNQAGDRVVWSEMVPGAQLHVYYKDADTAGSFNSCAGTVDQCATPLAPGYYWQENPAISPDGSKVAWEYGRSHGSQIHIYDFNTGEVQELYGMAGGDQLYPSVDNEWVVWEDKRDWHYGSALDQHIYAKRIGSPDPPITIADNGHSSRASVGPAKITRNSNDEPVIVYLSSIEDRYGSDTFTVHQYNLAESTDRPIYEKVGDLRSPHVDGDKVVWLDCTENSYCGVVLHDLPTGATQIVTQDPDLGARRPAVSMSSGYIVWLTSNLSPTTVYYNRIGDTAQELSEKYKPELRFSHDVEEPERDDFEPRTVELMVDTPGTMLRTATGEIENPHITALAENPTSGNFLDLPGSPVFPGFSDYSAPHLAQIAAAPDDYPTTAYVRVIQNAENTSKTVIQYWLCYYFNDFYNNHEGDWEMVEVILGRDLDPEAAAYSQHGKSFMKHWDEPGFEKVGGYPVVYVAQGSHANYFSEGVHRNRIVAGYTYDDWTNFESWADPELDFNGLAGENGWIDYAGHWGQEGIPFTWAESGARGPRFQPPIKDPSNNQWSPWDHPVHWAHASQDERADANDVVVILFSPADIHLYDQAGNHVGKNASGGADMDIPGSEYYERDEDHSKNIIIRNTDIEGNYRLEIEGTGSGTMDIKVQAPDFAGNLVDNIEYLTVPVTTVTRGELDISLAKDFDLSLDTDGDGVFEQQKAPDITEAEDMDFTPPSAVTDLAVTDTTAGTATLQWTAPGDDREQGTANRYDVRYSTVPIGEESWTYAKKAGSIPEPKVAGSAETATIEGLDAGITYYFAVRARDDVWQEGSISNVIYSTTTIPSLSWAIQRVFWANWDDYVNRHLSIDYLMSNTGTSLALASTIEASLCTPDTVYVVTPLPLLAGDIAPGSYTTLTLKYFVPTNVGRFTATTYATCEDDAGRIYWFPEELP